MSTSRSQRSPASLDGSSVNILPNLFSMERICLEDTSIMDIIVNRSPTRRVDHNKCQKIRGSRELLVSEGWQGISILENRGHHVLKTSGLGSRRLSTLLQPPRGACLPSSYRPNSRAPFDLQDISRGPRHFPSWQSGLATTIWSLFRLFWIIGGREGYHGQPSCFNSHLAFTK